MADSSLDDFFAKRDRNKKAKSKKFTTSDQIARKLEESGKKTTEMATKKEKEKISTSMPVSTSNVTQISEQIKQKDLGEDEEWRDFEEEKEKDYSGLKIHNLQITEPKEEELDRDRSQDLDEDGEPVKPRECNIGPWNKISNTSSNVAPEPIPQPVIVEEKKEESSPSVKSVYRPPHARQSSTPGGPPGGGGRSNKHSLKNAPEIGSELHFPSLSAAVESSKGSKKGGDKGYDSERGFESVKRGSRTSEEAVSRGPRLDLGNKFDALSQGEMS